MPEQGTGLVIIGTHEACVSNNVSSRHGGLLVSLAAAPLPLNFLTFYASTLLQVFLSRVYIYFYA